MSFNANGIRAATRKGFWDWFHKQNIDVLCIQETKAHESQLDETVLDQSGYHCWFSDAQKKGYSGVAIYSRAKPVNVIDALGFEESDTEGRWLMAEYESVNIASLYLPSGSSSEANQAKKERFIEKFEPQLKAWASSEKPTIICGDWNIAHTEKDIKNWKGNLKSSGFLPHEREWVSMLLEQQNWYDGFRLVNQDDLQYTWWSFRGRAWDNNAGWRIDYHMVNEALKELVVSEEVYRESRFSDHAPLTLEYDFKLS
ncbi:MAG: exodeoxyribonuclease III [Pseudomonadota bacterium]|nr:exodeoxyribonuclease III [Pseudomonadota bacterium]